MPGKYNNFEELRKDVESGKIDIFEAKKIAETEFPGTVGFDKALNLAYNNSQQGNMKQQLDYLNMPIDGIFNKLETGTMNFNEALNRIYDNESLYREYHNTTGTFEDAITNGSQPFGLMRNRPSLKDSPELGNIQRDVITPDQIDAKNADLRSKGQIPLEEAINMKTQSTTQENDVDKLKRYTQDHINGGETPERAAQLAQQEIDGQNRSYGNNYDEYLKNNPLTPEEQQAQQMQGNKSLFQSMPYLYAGGTDITTKANMLGQAIGAPQGAKGRGLGIIGGGLSLGLDLARNIAAGVGMSKVNKYTQEYSKDQVYGVDKNDYMSNPQYRNSNYTGGLPFGKFGGELRLFEGGGDMEMEDGQEQMQEGQEEQQPQGQPQDQQQQIFMAVANVLQQGGTPEQAVQMLMQNGVDQQTAMSIVQQVAQQFQQQQQTQQPQMKAGGTLGRKVGDEVDFTYEGKRYKGIIKKIENGKIFL
jgi:hypothetical protein